MTPGGWIWEKSFKYQKTANSLELMNVFSHHNSCASFCIIMLSNSKWHFWFFCNFQAKCCLQNKHAESFLKLMSSARASCIARSVFGGIEMGTFSLIVAAQMWAPNCFPPSLSSSRLQLCCANSSLWSWTSSYCCCFSAQLTGRLGRIVALPLPEHFGGTAGGLPPAQDGSCWMEVNISPWYQPSLDTGTCRVYLSPMLRSLCVYACKWGPVQARNSCSCSREAYVSDGTV